MDGHAESPDTEALAKFVVENEDLERLEALLAEFNLFEAIGAVRQELRHSDFLAFLLDPSGNHALGDLFLKELLKRALLGAANPPLSPVDIDVADLSRAEVRREWKNIDLFILDSASGFDCTIENKVDSGEHSDQLGRYRRAVESEYPGHRHIFVFLTPDGRLPQDQAFIPFSYASIAEVVDKLREARGSTLGADVTTLMKHYTTMLRRHIVSDSEVPELCRKIYQRHKQALDLIFEHKPDLQWDLSHAVQQMIVTSREHGIHADYTSKAYVRFYIEEWDRIPVLTQGQGWTRSGRVLLFEVQVLGDRLQLTLIVGPGPAHAREALYQLAESNPKLFKGRTTKLYPKYTTLMTQRWLGPTEYAEQDNELMIEKLAAQWTRFIDKDLPEIRAKIASIDWERVEAESSDRRE